MKLRLIAVFSLLWLMSFPTSAQIVINEYSCSNMSSFPDNFGEYEDWIELYNTSGAAVNLNGWYLSDKKSDPTKWKITTASIAANGFLRIWASGRNISTGTLHTNFKLTQCKPEALVLANPSGLIIDSFTLKRTQEGHSRGRTTNGAAVWSVFTSPTPNASNTNPYSEYAATPFISLPSGFYAGAQSVTLSCFTPGSTIRFTTNGSMPTITSTVYTGPIPINNTTVLRAAAFPPDPLMLKSFTASNTFFINVNHTVEVVSIFGDEILNLLNGSQINPYTGIEYFDHNGVLLTESFGTANKHGNDSWAYDQRGIDFVTRDQYGYNYALLGQIFNSKPRTEFQRIMFKAAANDNFPFENPGAAHIRDSYVHTLSQKAKLHMDERTWAPCVLYVNGQYWGVYDTREKVDDADFMEYYHNATEDSLQMLKTWGGTWSEYGGAQAQTDWNNLRNFILSNNMAIPANYDYVDSLYSIKSLTDYVILNSFVVCSDWLNWNTIWYRGLNTGADKRKWRYGLWDEDATFNHYINYTGIPNTSPNADPCDPNSLGDPGGEGHVPILNALMQSPTFYQYYIMRYFDLLNGPMNCDMMINLLDSMINVIQPEMTQHIARWGGSYSTWWSNYQTLRTFIQDRCAQVMQQFDDCWPVTGPWNLVVDVQPPGAGSIDLNSITLTQFIWSGQYPGNMTMLMTAHPDSGWCFDHWEMQHHNPSPGINDTAISFLYTTGDTVIAYFSNGSAPTLTANPPDICQGDTTQLLAIGGNTYSWSPASGLSCTDCPDPLAFPSSTTSYTVEATGNCGTGSAAITVNVMPVGTLLPALTTDYSTICEGDSAQFNVANGTTWDWSPATDLSCIDCPDPLAFPLSTTTYTVSITGGCSAGTASITLTIAPPPLLGDDQEVSICPGHSIQLTITGASYYQWNPVSGLSCSDCPSPMANPDMDITYEVIGSNGPGEQCRDTAMIRVRIVDDCPDLYIPTGFSPNHDQNNDTYRIYGDLLSMELIIYDRWGHVVFESKEQEREWDGTKDGKNLPSGVYVYKLNVTDLLGISRTYSGNITLVR